MYIFFQNSNIVVSLTSTGSTGFLYSFSTNIFKSIGKVNQTIFILELNVIYIHWFRKIKIKKEITFTTCNFTICYKVTCYLTTHLFDWLIVGFLTSSGKYVIHIQDENIFNILCRSFLLFAYYIYSHWRSHYQSGGDTTITSLSLATLCACFLSEPEFQMS
jgi:hypothetical protein